MTDDSNGFNDEYIIDVLIDEFENKIIPVDVDSYIDFICKRYEFQNNYTSIRTYIMMDILKPCLDENGDINPDVFHVMCNLYLHPNFKDEEVKKKIIRIDRKIKLDRIKNK